MFLGVDSLSTFLFSLTSGLRSGTKCLAANLIKHKHDYSGQRQVVLLTFKLCCYVSVLKDATISSLLFAL